MIYEDHGDQDEYERRSEAAFHLWSDEKAENIALCQDGASNCGATALMNVLRALDFQPMPAVSVANDAVNTNLRAPPSLGLKNYLEARSVAGCTGKDIVAGCDKITDGRLVARFFPFFPPPSVNLQAWLAGWLGMGCPAVATLNTQVMYGADYWHHQMIYGVDAEGVHVTNPVEILNMKEILSGLTTPSTLKVHARDAMRCSPFDVDACDEVSDAWARLRVSDQLKQLQTGNTSGVVATHVEIPAAYRAGITVFAVKGTNAAKALLAADWSLNSALSYVTPYPATKYSLTLTHPYVA